MTIDISETRTIKLTDKQMKEITKEYLRKRFDIDEFMSINDDNLMHTVEYIGSHKWSSIEAYRPRKKIDKCVLKILKKLAIKK